MLKELCMLPQDKKNRRIGPYGSSKCLSVASNVRCLTSQKNIIVMHATFGNHLAFFVKLECAVKKT